MSRTPIQQVILFQIEQTSKVAKQYSQREFDRLGLGITVEQWVLLKIIQEEGPLSQRDLATRSHRDPASITRTLDLLEKGGLVRRLDHESDRRQYQLALSPKGKTFIDRHMELVQSLRDLSTAGFSKAELEQLSAFLLRIQDNMR